MSNCLSLECGGCVEEKVSASEFAEVKSDVHHIKGDLKEMKEDNKTLSRGIQSIDVSLAKITEHIESNKRLSERVTRVESAINKINIKIALATGGVTSIFYLIEKFTR